jgi:2-polyprenyl-3-methyl-5-hydroxy-6-metoxy-1,4-benzoquinol methylase
MSAPGKKPGPATSPELLVIIPLKGFRCATCGGSGNFLVMDDPGALCLSCADLDHLVFLSAGNAALSRRARTHSTFQGSPGSPRAIASLCDDARVTDEELTGGVLTDQVAYYRRRADEYDVTAYGDDVAAARALIARLVAEMRPVGSVLEIACGTGLWTEALAVWADTVTAIDAAPEMVAIARDRVQSANVSFEVADVFSWHSATRFEVVFFSAWLSHVPASWFERFWQLLRTLLAGGGRVLFIDEHVDERGKEAYVAGQEEVVERQLGDGSTFRVIKNFVEPEELKLRLGRMGWDCEIRRVSSRWVYGEARLTR